MKKTESKILAFCLSIVMTFSLLSCAIIGIKHQNNTQTVYALTGQELTDLKDDAGEIMQNVIDALAPIFEDEDGIVSVKSIFKTIFSGVGYVNAGASFLKLIGVMKDGTGEALARIQAQLNLISDQLVAIDAKLDAIINEMAALKGETKFIARTDAARDYRRYFNDFIRDYCTKGLNPLITDFESMRIDAMKKWYNSTTAEARVGEMLDNSQVILVWDYKENEEPFFHLRYHLSNELPADCADPEFAGRYIILPASALPTKTQVSQWNVDTYHEELSNFIYDQIVAHENEYEKAGYYDQPMNDYMKRTAASDAVNFLVYRATAESVNESSAFANTVLDKFNDYVTYLLKDENGFDALIKALYYTHTFEGEVAESIINLYQSLVFEVGYYGSFVRDVINMSNDVSKEKKTAFDESYAKTIVKTKKAKDKAITGYSNYCYITNTVLYYGVSSMTATGQIKSHSPTGGGPGGGFDWYTATDFVVENYRTDTGGTRKKYNNSALIGGDAATLISLTLRSNGINADHDYLVSKLASAQGVENCNAIIVANEGISSIPFDSTTPLYTHLVLGNYFPADRDITLRAYQNKYDPDYLVHRRQVKGSLFDFTSTSLNSSTVLAAFAIYGESHWYWSLDEACFMSGPSIGKVDRSCTRATPPTTKDHIDSYNVTFKYNVILQEVIEPTLEIESGQPNSLYSFRQKNHHVDPTNTEQVGPVVPETYGNDSGYSSKAGYYCIIIIPCVVGGVGIFLGVYFCVKAYRKKKRV